MFRSANGKKQPERIKIAQEICKIMIDEQYSIGTVGQSPATMGVRIVSRKMGNIPSRQINAQHCRTPGTSQPVDVLLQGVGATTPHPGPGRPARPPGRRAGGVAGVD